MTRHRPIVAGIALGTLAIVLAALALAGEWPFDDGANDPAAERHVVWDGSVELSEGSRYALDVPPVTAEARCTTCLWIQTDSHGQSTLAAANGIQGWRDTEAPSYIDCVRWRNKLTLDSVALGGRRASLHAVPLHGWICATGGKGGLMRLRYNGRRDGRFLFSVTSWGVPAEG